MNNTVLIAFIMICSLAGDLMQQKYELIYKVAAKKKTNSLEWQIYAIVLLIFVSFIINPNAPHYFLSALLNTF
ncbi:MAG: hypothetical protein CBB87_08235 [Micavibrio sp. TMED27]|nr:hypothetical protein [Micavibrio sp.]OUT90658.1 MAG: hypothetical protein CBB87_08235 [Micavibrio sp. TMED27]|tara:strand:- start:1220 stop:1438 length:219 start_codon:yes stop_codon:yes gene_type:complete